MPATEPIAEELVEEVPEPLPEELVVQEPEALEEPAVDEPEDALREDGQQALSEHYNELYELSKSEIIIKTFDGKEQKLSFQNLVEAPLKVGVEVDLKNKARNLIKLEESGFFYMDFLTGEFVSESDDYVLNFDPTLWTLEIKKRKRFLFF